MKVKLILLGIIILAASLRLSAVWYMEFKGDEATISFIASDFVHKGIFPLVGDRSSQGMYNPAMFIYLLSIPFMFSNNPVIAVSYIALLNIFAVYLCFLFCSHFLNKRVALIASAFFAVNPWVILYSHKIWANNLLVLFVLVFFYSLFKVIFTHKYRYFFLSLLALAILTQLHFSAIFLGIVLVLTIFIFQLRIKIRDYIAAIGVFIILYIPYILFDLKNNFYNLNAFLKFSSLPFKMRWDAFSAPFQLATADGFESSLGASFSEFSKIIPNISVFNKLSAALIMIAVVYLTVNIFREKKYIILLLWFLVPPLFIVFSKNYFGRAAFISIFPVQFICVAVFCDFAITKLEKHKPLKWVFCCIIAALFTCQFIFSQGFNKFIKTKKCIYGDYGPPFKYHVEAVKDAIKNGSYDIEGIWQEVAKDKRCFKNDFIATKYIFENIKGIR
ncbi:MAG: hypothetical protein V1650_02605 [Candidatus Omnitrophota bacterium]